MNIVKGLSNFIKTGFKLFTKDSNSLGYRFLVIGDRSVGKTSFINKAINDSFDLEIEPSKESECYSMELKFGHNIIELFLVDISTPELSKNHGYIFRNVNGAFVLYDITKRNTFEKVETYVSDIKSNLGFKAPIVIIGNKKDLKHLREVQESELKELSFQLNCDHSETTCTDENSVFDIVKFLVFKSYYNSLSEEKQKEILKMF